MPLPEVADTYMLRIKWESSAGQRPAYNQLFFLDGLGTQDEAALITDLNNLIAQNMWLVVSTSAGIKQMWVTKLDGISATVENTGFLVGGANFSGSGGADPILQGACVVSERSAFRGKPFRGRIYLPFVGETNQAGGVITSANVATMNTAWETFRTGMQAQNWFPVVVSPSQIPATQVEIQGFTVKPNLYTQRRRARR